MTHEQLRAWQKKAYAEIESLKEKLGEYQNLIYRHNRELTEREWLVKKICEDLDKPEQPKVPARR